MMTAYCPSAAGLNRFANKRAPSRIGTAISRFVTIGLTSKCDFLLGSLEAPLLGSSHEVAEKDCASIRSAAGSVAD
jgi:hypothetical protein